MADNSTRIVITATDQASAVLNRVQQSMGSLSAALPALGSALSVGAFAGWVKGSIDAADSMNDLSQRVGINIKELAGWTLAANQSGASMESVAKGVKGLSTYMVEHGDKLRAAGISATDANGALVQLSDLFKAMPDGVEKTALAVQLFGKAGMDMIPMLNMGSAGLAEAQAKAAEYGRKMAELAPLADEFNDKLEELSIQSKAAGINIAQHFLPGLIGLSSWLGDVSAGGDRARQALEWLTGAREGFFGRSQGYSGPKTALGLPASPAEIAAMNAAPATTPEQAAAQAKARKLLDKTGAGTAAGAKTPLERMLEQQQKRLADIAATAGDEQMVSVDTIARQYEKAMADKAQTMADAHEARMEQQRIETEGEEAIREALEKQSLALKEHKDIAKDLGLTFSSAFEDAIIGGKKFSDVLQGLAMDVARIVVRKIVTEPLGNSLAGLFGNLFKNADGGVYASPDLHRYANTIVSSPTLFKFAQGGAFTGLMGEAGAEAILPLRRGPGGKLGVESSGAPAVTVNVINQTGSPAAARQQGAPQWDGAQWVVGVVMERAATDPAFRAAFGMGR